jgi:hypothetical protein
MGERMEPTSADSEKFWEEYRQWYGQPTGLPCPTPDAGGNRSGGILSRTATGFVAAPITTGVRRRATAQTNPSSDQGVLPAKTGCMLPLTIPLAALGAPALGGLELEKWSPRRRSSS